MNDHPINDTENPPGNPGVDPSNVINSLPESYDFPPEVKEAWEAISPQEPLAFTKTMLTGLHTIISNLCFANIAQSKLLVASRRNDNGAAEHAFAEIGKLLVDTENMSRRLITLATANHEVGRLQDQEETESGS